MKRIIISLATFLVACQVSAQTIDSLPNHNLGRRWAQTETFMEMSDSSLLGGIMMADPSGPLGYVLHKVSRHNSRLEISDTLFMPYDHFPWHYTVKDPNGNGNILAEFDNDFEDGSCLLRIRWFNDDLVFDTTDVVVPLAHFTGNSGDPGLLLEPNGDIMFYYYDYYSSPLEFNFVRIGLDGTIKHQASIDTFQIKPGSDMGPIVFSESPLSYCIWGDFFIPSSPNSPAGKDYLNCYVLDSLFNVTDSYTFLDESGSPDYVFYHMNGFTTKLLGLEDGSFLVARGYNRPSALVPYIEDDGVVVMKYDNDFNLLAQRKFLSEPYIPYNSFAAQSVGLEKSKDGHVYFAYFTHFINTPSQVSVVKMDSDLNIIWQRHCLGKEPGRDFGSMIVLDDNSVAVMGINNCISNLQLDHTEAFYLVVHDDYDALEEQGFIVRPYAYYPNPAQDELHLQYSPDVTPTQIELHDLQGRMVRSQRNGLESLNLQGLSSGTYTMRVTLAGGKVFTDKVVKN